MRFIKKNIDTYMHIFNLKKYVKNYKQKNIQNG